VTPAEVARVAMRLGDALLAIAEEMRREDACAAILEADCASVARLCDALITERGSHVFALPGPAYVTANLMARGADQIEEWGDSWKSWGERLAAQGHAWETNNT
jgi:hypothetical protein